MAHWSSVNTSVIDVTSEVNLGFLRDLDISGELIFRVSTNKGPYLEKYLTAFVLVKSSGSPIQTLGAAPLHLSGGPCYEVVPHTI